MPTRTCASDAEANYQLGVIIAIGNPHKALPFFKDALKSEPDHCAKVTLLLWRKCRPWLFLPDDGDTQTPLFDEDVELDLLYEDWYNDSDSLG